MEISQSWRTIILCLLVFGSHFARAALSQVGAHVLFKKTGETAYELQFANVAISINVQDTIDQIIYLRTALIEDRVKQGISPGTDSWQHREYDIIKTKRLERRCRRLMYFRADVPKETKRSKRFVFTALILAVFAIGAAAAGYGIYHNLEISKMERNVNTVHAAEISTIREIQHQTETHADLAKQVEVLAETIKDHYGNIYTSGVAAATLELAERRTQQAEAAIDGLMHKRLTPAALNDVDIFKTTKGVSANALQLGLVPMAKFYTDYLQLETSFYSTPTGFKAFIHVPLIGPESTMYIYRHARIPFPLGEGLFGTVESQKEYLAINKDKKYYRAISATELNECPTMGDFHMCVFGNVVSKAPRIPFNPNKQDRDEVCLWSLFNQNIDLAAQTCSTFVTSAPDTVVQVNANDFLVYNKDPELVALHCRNTTDKSRRTFQVQGFSMVTVPDTCTAETETHLFSASDVAFTRDADKWALEYKWEDLMKKIVSEDDMSKLSNTSLNLQRLVEGGKRIPLAEVLDKLQREKSEETPPITGIFSFLNHIGTGGLGMIAIVALILSLYLFFTKPPTEKEISATPNNESAAPQKIEINYGGLQTVK